METLLHALRYQPKLSKDASSALVDLGEAISVTATRSEIDVLLRGMLLQEVYVRNSCLQAIQVGPHSSLSWFSLNHCRVVAV